MDTHEHYCRRILVAVVVIVAIAACAMGYKSVDNGSSDAEPPNLEGGWGYPDMDFDVIFSSQIMDMGDGTFIAVIGVSNFNCPDEVVLDVDDILLTNGSEDISYDPVKSANGPGCVESQVIYIGSPGSMLFLYFD
ncbi:MAG: hypothetical protein ACI38Y_03935, partial [Candidatus Methanomethylophilaceae archaeon]